jgi:anti-sigma-K factor RskA
LTKADLEMTSSEQNQGGRAQDEILAGEYVLGVLLPEARRGVERRMAYDRAFARIVKRWKADIAALKDDDVDVVPMQARLRRIERQPDLALRPASRMVSLWGSTAFWRIMALGALAIAAAALIPQVAPIATPQRQAARLGELAVPASQLGLLATYDAASGLLRLAPVGTGLPAENALQLWLVTSDGRQQSLGTLGRNADGALTVPVELQGGLGEGATLMVSLEPLGGSQTGLPSGPVVAKGPVQGF